MLKESPIFCCLKVYYTFLCLIFTFPCITFIKFFYEFFNKFFLILFFVIISCYCHHFSFQFFNFLTFNFLSHRNRQKFMYVPSWHISVVEGIIFPLVLCMFEATIVIFIFLYTSWRVST